MKILAMILVFASLASCVPQPTNYRIQDPTYTSSSKTVTRPYVAPIKKKSTTPFFKTKKK